MFEKLKRFLQGEPPPIVATIEDTALGTLSWSEDEEAWMSRPDFGFAFQISGTPKPDALLIRHAADISRKKEEFIRSVQRILGEEATSVRHLSAFKDEIAGLKVERVCLFWVDRPDDGLIYFDGGRDHRVWRCDYVGRVPQGLGFDS